jgi:methanogenic corrinoid protein MtbC1
MRYTVKAAAIATGISESRLRTWERRYGIPSPDRSATGRRLYDQRDLAVIRRMAALVGAGIPAFQAAEAARIEHPLTEILPVREDHALASTFVTAAVAYDEPAAIAAIREASGTLGWPVTLDVVLMPALRRMGQFWGDDTIVSASEHFATEVIRREISAAYVDVQAAGAEAPTVVLACAEDERHELGLLGLALLLRMEGLRVLYLGADVPVHDLILAIRDTKAPAVCLSATLASSTGTLGRAARNIVSSKLHTKLFVGGPGLGNGSDVEAVPGIHLPPSLSAAADVITKSLRGAYKEASE